MTTSERRNNGHRSICCRAGEVFATGAATTAFTAGGMQSPLPLPSLSLRLTHCLPPLTWGLCIPRVSFVLLVQTHSTTPIVTHPDMMYVWWCLVCFLAESTRPRPPEYIYVGATMGQVGERGGASWSDCSSDGWVPERLHSA